MEIIKRIIRGLIFLSLGMLTQHFIFEHPNYSNLSTIPKVAIFMGIIGCVFLLTVIFMPIEEE